MPRDPLPLSFLGAGAGAGASEAGTGALGPGGGRGGAEFELFAGVAGTGAGSFGTGKDGGAAFPLPYFSSNKVQVRPASHPPTMECSAHGQLRPFPSFTTIGWESVPLVEGAGVGVSTRWLTISTVGILMGSRGAVSPLPLKSPKSVSPPPPKSPRPPSKSPPLPPEWTPRLHICCGASALKRKFLLAASAFSLRRGSRVCCAWISNSAVPSERTWL